MKRLLAKWKLKYLKWKLLKKDEKNFRGETFDEFYVRVFHETPSCECPFSFQDTIYFFKNEDPNNLYHTKDGVSFQICHGDFIHYQD